MLPTKRVATDDRPTTRQRVVLITALQIGCAAVLLVAVVIALSLQEDQLKAYLALWAPSAFFAGSLIAIGALLATRTEFLRSIFTLFLRSRGASLVVLLCAATLLVELPPITNRIYFDEHIYQGIGLSILKAGKAHFCLDCYQHGSQFEERWFLYNKQPIGMSALESIFFGIFGVSGWSSHLVNSSSYFIGTLSVMFLAWLLYESAFVACAASLLYATTPLILRWAATVAVEPSASAFVALGLCAFAFYVKFPSYATSLLGFSALGISLFFRPESIVTILPAIIIAFKYVKIECKEPRFYVGLLVLCLVGSVEFLHLFAVQHEDWGSKGDKFSLSIFWSNIKVNGYFYLINKEFPVFFTILAVPGILSLRRRFSETLAMIVWFLYSWGVFLFFYAGSYHYGADERFSLMSSAPLSLLGGVGAYILYQSLCRRLHHLVSLGLIVGVGIATWLPFIPLIRLVGEEANDARYDVALCDEIANKVPPGALVLSHVPSIWLLLGKSGAQTSLATTHPAYIAQRIAEAGTTGVFFHRGAWCNYEDKIQNRFCEELAKNFVIEEIDAREYKGRLYGLYKVISPKT